MKIKHALSIAFSFAMLGQMLPMPVAEAEDATDCDITYTRTACPGQEAESYKKCDGKQTCTKHVAAASEAACAEAAVQACSNDRLEITQSKVIHASFKGKALKAKSGKEDMCLDYAKRDTEFNQCGKKK
jgi:hypothetical protein